MMRPKKLPPLLLSFFFLLSYFGAYGQCSNNNTLWPGADNLTPSCSEQVVNMEAGTYAVFNVVQGLEYQFRTCGSGWDTQLTGYTDNASNTVLFYNDDAGGACTQCNSPACGSGTNPSNLKWTATLTGKIRVVLDRFDCLSCSINNCPAWGTVPLQYRQIINAPIVPSQGCNDNNTLWPGADNLTPSCTEQTINMEAGTYAVFNVVQGLEYQFRTCGSGWDTQLTGFVEYGPACTSFVFYNDDAGGACNNCNSPACDSGTNPSNLKWTANFTGKLRVVLDRFNCLSCSINNCSSWGTVPLQYQQVINLPIVSSQGCGDNNTLWPGADNLTPTCTEQTINMEAGTYAVFNVTQGVQYQFRTCGSGWDTQLTGFAEYGPACTSFVFYNDDQGGACTNCSSPSCGSGVNPSSLRWTATFTGKLRLVLDRFNCLSCSINNCSSWGTVPVQYKELPNAQCEDITLSLDANGSVTLLPGDLTSNTSICSNQSISPNTFNCGQIGANTVTLSISEQGFTSTCTASVHIVDDTAPVVSCSPVESNNTAVVINTPVDIGALGTAMWTQPDIDAATAPSIDNCEITSRAVAPTSFNCSDIGSNLVFTLTLTDQSSNSATCTITYTNIVDATPPIAQCQDATVNLDNNGSGLLSESDIDNGSSDLCGNPSLALSQNVFGCQDVGNTTVTLTSTDIGGNTSTCTATVTVQNLIMPVASCQNMTLSLDSNGEASITPGDIDNGSTGACIAEQMVSPNSFNCTNVGTNTVTLTVASQDDNSSICTATVTIVDDTAPIVSCSPVEFNNTAVVINTPFDIGALGTATWTQQDIDGITIASIDNCEIVSRTISPSSFTCSDIGSTIVFTLTLSDQSSNSSTCTITYTNIVDETPPDVQCKDVTVQLDLNGTGGLMATEVDNGSSDVCGISSLTVSPDNFNCDDLGMNVVTLSATDSGGNGQTCTASVTVAGISCEWSIDPNGIDCVDAEVAYDVDTEAITLTSESCVPQGYYRLADSQGFIWQELCTDGEIIAQVTQVNGNGWAGISMRETNDPSARMIQLMIDGIALTRREFRQSTGGLAFVHQFQTLGKNWLRLSRTGSQFTAAHSQDGTNWSLVISAYMPMASCFNVGLVTMNNASTGAVSGVFEHVSVTGIGPLNAPQASEINHYILPKPDFILYPNPTTGHFNIQLEQFQGQDIQMRMYNLFGQKVYEKDWTEVFYHLEQVPVDKLPPGTYLVEIRAPGFRQSKKLTLTKP